MSKEEYNSKGLHTEDESEDTVYQEAKQDTDNEDTIVISTAKNCPQPVIVDMEPVIETYAEEVGTSSGKPSGGMSRWKKVTIGSVTGISLGIASAYALHGGNSPEPLHRQETGPEEETGPEKEPRTGEDVQTGQEATPPPAQNQSPEPLTPPVVEDIEDIRTTDIPSDDFRVATDVHDNMTFGEAFMAARSQVGPGGLFEFEGELYSTYNEYEWDSMSSAEKEAYNDRLNSHIRENHHPDASNPPADDTDNVIQTTATTDVEQGTEVIQSTETVETKPEFEIHHIAQDAEEGVSMVIGSIGDTGVTFIDTPETPYVEIMAVDANQNGQLDEGEVINVTESYIQMDDLTAGTMYEGYQTPEVDDIPTLEV